MTPLPTPKFNQHLYTPEEMLAYGQACFEEGRNSNPPLAYTIMCSKKSVATLDWFAPLSYGRGNEPAHDQLLMRGRATLFDTSKEAFDALQASLIKSKDGGATWPEKYTYSVVECGK